MESPVYYGSSMYRVFTPGERLELEEVGFDDLQVGDVVVVNVPGQKQYVHRIIEKKSGVAVTMGDNNADIDDFRDMQDELIDRFGDIPSSAQALLDIALLRADASRVDIKEIAQKDGKLFFYLRDIQPERVLALCALPDFKVRLTINAGDKPCFILKLKPGENSLAAAKKLVAFYSEGGKQ